jgi:crotonobetainyl-CoA:carnitine CoA-transferase CaiB-like acyl-CoA transferase
LPYGSISAISLAAKAILIAKIWKERTGEEQDIHVDVRKALLRLTQFLDRKWELLNGFPGRTDSHSPFVGGPDIVPTKDGKWAMLADVFPALRQRALDLLNPKGGFYEAVRDAVKEWNGEERRTRRESGHPHAARPQHQRRAEDGYLYQVRGADAARQRRDVTTVTVGRSMERASV